MFLIGIGADLIFKKGDDNHETQFFTAYASWTMRLDMKDLGKIGED